MSTSGKQYQCGQRLSYDGHLCTVRYVGTVEGTKGSWLGVEWDEPDRGKHAGEHQGVKYFECIRKSSTTASFVRPSRSPDVSQSLIDAVKSKYAPETTLMGLRQCGPARPYLQPELIRIGGKEVEEVGFDKISRQLANLQELRILVLNGLCISTNGNDAVDEGTETFGSVCPNTRELDLSRNLIDSWETIYRIICELPFLTSLKVDGNRFGPLKHGSTISDQNRHPLSSSLFSLSLDDCLIDNQNIREVSGWLGQSLQTLSLSNNELEALDLGTIPPSIGRLVLDGNKFLSLPDLKHIETLANLRILSLKDNAISSTGGDRDGSSLPLHASLAEIDLAYNKVHHWTFLDQLSVLFPSLTSLRLSGNPLLPSRTSEDGGKAADDIYMLVIARLGSLKTLNHSLITSPERLNAETYYLSQIGKELASHPEDEAAAILALHPRFDELCEKYGSPVIVRKPVGEIDPNSLAARLIRLHFHLELSTTESRKPSSLSLELPNTLTVYNVLGIVGFHFQLSPMLLQLVWETGEESNLPFGRGDEEEDDDQDDDDDDDEVANVARNETKTQQPPLTLREDVLLPRTRTLATWINGTSANIRVEWSEEERRRHAAFMDPFKI